MASGALKRFYHMNRMKKNGANRKKFSTSVLPSPTSSHRTTAQAPLQRNSAALAHTKMFNHVVL